MSRSKVILLVIIGFSVWAALASRFVKPEDKPADTAPKPATMATQRPDVTMGIFESVGPPLKYDQLKSLIGPGRLVSESYGGGYVTQGIRYENSDGSYMGLVVQNGVIVSKQQSGLR